MTAEQLDLLAPTHTNDPVTSKIAAKKAGRAAPTHWNAILRALSDAPDGLTADEMLEPTGISQRHVAQTRAGEMTREHLKDSVFAEPLVERTERKRNTSPSGGPAVVYVLTALGRSYVEALGETRVA